MLSVGCIWILEVFMVNHKGESDDKYDKYDTIEVHVLD